jgi:CheY-like chemotaxis protein
VRILVVEDEFLVRVVACEALLDEGFEVSEAATGAEALALLDEPVDLILTDVIMPGPVDGWEVAERFRERWPQVSVIYTSGYPLERRPVTDGALLMKPYRIAELIAAVRAKQRALNPDKAA